MVLWYFSDNIKDITSAQSKVMLYDGKSWTKPPKSWNIPSEQLHYVGNLKKWDVLLNGWGDFMFLMVKNL
ncbi:MAG: hypothetical protein IPJ03_14430 [Ignavibacteriales bacterium]|nr:hypothetical protein [Ignavibacteriales bacterium]